MRGKLRDKRADKLPGYVKRDQMDRRRLNKRNNRTLAYLNQQLDDDEEAYLEKDQIKVTPTATK
jgi:hypothetical protein